MSDAHITVTEFLRARGITVPAAPAAPHPAEDRLQEFRATAESLRPVILETARRLMKREAAQVGSALERNASNTPRFLAWASAYFEREADEFAQAFAPVGTALEELAGRHGLAGVAAPGAILEVARTRAARLASIEAIRAHVATPEDERVRALASPVFDAFLRDVRESTHAA